MTDFSKIAERAAAAENLTEESQGFVRELPRAGVALLRLRDYIELGYFDSKNPKYKPALSCRLTFELCHPDHMREDSEGVKYPSLLTVNVNHARGGKSRYIRLFKKMNHTGKHTHFIQMLGEGFLGTLTHKKDGDKTYVNLTSEDGSEWLIGAPVIVDPLANEVKPIPVPELNGESKAFLWENTGATDEDIQEMWDSIYIEGENDDGKSKNWIQEVIKTNNNYAGSRTQAIVDGAVTEVDIPEQDLSALVDTTSAEAAGAAVVEAKAEEAMAPQADAVDPLVALGLA